MRPTTPPPGGQALQVSGHQVPWLALRPAAPMPPATYRQVLHNTLLAGATGWIARCNSDYDDLSVQDPYRHHAFELGFGLTDSRGRPKLPLAEMKASTRSRTTT